MGIGILDSKEKTLTLIELIKNLNYAKTAFSLYFYYTNTHILRKFKSPEIINYIMTSKKI